MKTLLMWGVGSHFSARAAQKLAADGHRLLMLGEDSRVLDELDASLVQSELHRRGVTPHVNEVATWVQDQNLGLDGLLVFPPPPEPNASVFVPLSINLRASDSSVFGVVELVRELLPVLRRGKRPKRILVVLDWHNPVKPTPLGAVLTETWQALLPAITHELTKEGSHFNVLCLRESANPLPAAPTPLATAQTSDAPLLDVPVSKAVETQLVSPEANVTGTSEFVQAAVSLTSLYFSPTMQFLNGQFLQHPSTAVSRGVASSLRQ